MTAPVDPPESPRLRRLRRRFVWAAAVLMAPLLLLVGRAIWGVEAEYRAYHESVARRLFDDMEQGLTELLRTEERRPVAAYAGAIDRPPYVLGHFEYVDGYRMTAGALPEARAALDGHRRPSGDDAGWLAPSRPGALSWLAPGSTVAHNALPNISKSSLGSLNRGGDRRRAASNAGELGAWGHRLAALTTDPGADPQRALTDVYDPELRVSLMRAAAVGDEYLVLERFVSDRGRERSQGVVISVSLLGRHLVERTLTGSPVAAAATLGVSVDPEVPADAIHGFTHRFGMPFDAIGASLVLASLPDAVDTGWVYGLGLGLLALAPLGLLALYRMSAVTVRFAERQSDFVSAVTHELKTPLTSIRMYGEMLRDGVVPDPSKQQRYYTHITAEAERLSRLIGNVLELARLEKGRRPMNPVVGDAGDALRAVAELFGPQAAAAGFELVVDAAPGLPAVEVDRDALVQVIFNLVDNAVKYARDADDRRIVLRAEAAADGVVLAVRDHGPGVPARQLEQVFEPFFRGERELTRTAKGTGIGLALVRGLVQRMGGVVAAGNARGGGLEVRIRLPASG